MTYIIIDRECLLFITIKIEINYMIGILNNLNKLLFIFIPFYFLFLPLI
jgi:hypothetical protein